jgi:predicted aspartyl protease
MRFSMMGVRGLAASLCLVVMPTGAGEFDTRIPMSSGGAATFYVQGQLGDLESTGFMVDTGSGYMTINQASLDQLNERNLAHYDRDLIGVLADGSELRVPIYRISRLELGAGCVLEDVEAALFPAKRQILGLNVLNRAAPFIFSVDPPELVLSHCQPDMVAGVEPGTGLPAETAQKTQ